jgi:benzoyl-CoA reductase/2-hydroxyglutaryl-CoA dehydratase subunit BcrC/BadD/HgdB
MIELIREYEVDGFVMHSNRSCKPYSLGQYDIKRIVSAETGVPGLIIDADMCDSRYYSEEQIRNRIDAFIEQLESGV